MKQVSAASDSPYKRRKFLKLLSAGWAATMAYPVLESTAATSKTKFIPASLTPYEDLPDERFWEKIKQQFAVPANMIMVNAANLCPSPVSISDQIFTSLKSLERDVSFQNRAKFEKDRKVAIGMLAK